VKSLHIRIVDEDDDEHANGKDSPHLNSPGAAFTRKVSEMTVGFTYIFGIENYCSCAEGL
jgi:hypothetical protein